MRIIDLSSYVCSSDLSKRDGAKDILDYRAEGYLPEAMRNFLASLGWNDGTEQEVFSTDELIQKFSLNRVQKSGARFDERRLVWMNGQQIRLIRSEKSRVGNACESTVQYRGSPG